MDALKLVLLAVVVVGILFWISNRRPKDFPPGPLGLPVVGYLPFFGELPFKTCVQLGKKYGNVFSVKLGNSFVVVLNDWSAIKEALVNQSDAFEGRPLNIIYETIYEYKGIGFSSGEEWRERRKFTLHQLKSLGYGKSSFERVIMDEVIVLLQKLQGHNNQTVKIENYFYFFDAHLNIVWSLVGGQIDCGDAGQNQFKEIVRCSFEAITGTNPFFYMPYLRHVLRKDFQAITTNNEKFNKFLSNALQQHVDTYQDGDVRDIMDAGLAHMYNQQKNISKNSVSFTKDNIIQIAKDLFLAGTDTCSNTLTWALLYMSLWPTFQEKVQQEMDDVFGRQRLPTFKDQSLLPYTCAVIQEIHRYATIGPFAVLHSVMRDTKLFGYTLPKGTVIVPNVWAVHHDQSTWGDPEVFRPERFLNETGQLDKPEYFIPFSVGGRICPGKSLADMTTFLIFTCLLHEFTFSLPPGEKLPGLDPVYTQTLFPRPFFINVTQRSANLLL